MQDFLQPFGREMDQLFPEVAMVVDVTSSAVHR